jgi:hypothetical protein
MNGYPRAVARILAHAPAPLITLGAALGMAGAARVLPTDLALILAAWILFSVPLGVGIGHCVMTGD